MRFRRVLLLVAIVVLTAVAVLPSLHSALATRVYSAVDVGNVLVPSGWSGLMFPVNHGDVIVLSFETVNASYDVFLRFGESVYWSDPSVYPFQVANMSEGSFRYVVPEEGMIELAWRPVWAPESPQTFAETPVAFAYGMKVIPNPSGLSLVSWLS